MGEVFGRSPLTALEEKPRRGRPLLINDASLEGARDELIWFLEGIWGEIGWELQTAKKIEDIRKAFQPLNGLHSSYRLNLLVRPSVLESTPQRLRSVSKQLGRMNDRIRAWDEEERRLHELLSQAMLAMEQAKGTPQEHEIKLICNQREQQLKSFSMKYEALQEEERVLRDRRIDEQAYVAQTEMLKFILSRRYSFTPLNVANAMAGLPDMLWRQSSKRCAAMKCSIANGSSYQLFKMVRRANQSTSSSQEVLDTIQKRLLNSRKNDYVAAELRKNWYFLCAAVSAAMGQKPHPHSVPYRILAEYRRRTRSLTAVDSVLAEEHCLR